MRNLSVLLLLSAGCIAGHAVVERDDRLLREVQISEDRISRTPAQQKQARLSTSPLPQPRPFLDAAAKVVHAHPEMAKELDKLPPDDATKVRARLAELNLQKEEAKPPPAPAAPAPPESEAQAPSDTLSISNETAALIARKGPPRSITWRADGLFNLHWDDTDVLVYPDGKLAPPEK